MRRTFQCPKCDAVVIAIATQVAHKCKANKSAMTEFVEVVEQN